MGVGPGSVGGTGAGVLRGMATRTVVFLPLRTRSFFFGCTVAPGALTLYSPGRSRYVLVEVPALRKPLDRRV